MAITNKVTSERNSTLIGAAGEHYVMSILLRQNLICTLAPVGAPDFDILITERDGKKVSTIQVKTTTGNTGGWQMREKHEKPIAGMFYCFVNFWHETDKLPECYIVPSEKVANILQNDHQSWVNTPAKNGKTRNNGDMRKLCRDHTKNLGSNTEYCEGWLNKYKNNWDQLRSKKDA